MTALLTDNLPLLAIAPNGIKKLRELILELAMRGKLVPQDASDESAGELLLRIGEGKAGSVEKNAAKKNKPRGAGADSAAPYQLPTGWQWSSLAQIAFVNPRNFASDNLEVSFVPMTLIGTRFDGQHGQEFRTWGDVKQGFTHFAEGDIGVAKITPCFENSKACVFAGLRNGLGAGTTELHIVRPVPGTLDARYVLAYLKSPQFLLAGETKMTGTAGQKRLPKEFVEANPFPLPPLSEQYRIVAKVDALMALCDRLEAQQIDAETAHEHLVKALLDSLTQATDAADFAISWQRLSVHFHTLFTTESSVGALKQTLLQLAVVGKLLPQNSGDESASELLKRIATEKARLTAIGAVKKQKPFEHIAEQEVPFLVPDNWAWSRIGEIVLSTEYGLSEKTSDLQEGVPVLKMGDVQGGRVLLEGQMKVGRATVGLPDLYLEPEDLLYNRTNSAELVGKTGIFLGRSNVFTFASYLIRIRCMKALLSPAYLNISMNSPSFRETQITPHLKQQCGQANVNGTIMRNMLVSVPPLAEQHRIVAKVDELMVLCDQLKIGIAKAKALNEALGSALVAEAIEPTGPVPSLINLSSYLVRNLAARPTFGRTAHMKWLFLADQHLGLELGMSYERQAAGPLDKVIYEIEERAAQSQLYAIQKEALKSGSEKVVYCPKPAIDRAADAGAAELGDKRAELDRLVGLLAAHKTEDLEIVATLYAVWNDVLAEGRQPDDGWLINEFRTNWHKGKERFSPELLAKWLSWMREHRLVPAGKISSTRHQGSLLH